MNTQKIARICKSDPWLTKAFVGVFPCDKLPEIDSYPCAFIINTKPSTHPGEHWVAVFVDAEQQGGFFCSYGSKPGKTMTQWLNSYCDSWKRNEKRLQAYHTSTCGQYCVCFLHFRCRDVSFAKFCDLFASDYVENDHCVVGFVNGLYDEDTVVCDVEFIVNQIAQSGRVE